VVSLKMIIPIAVVVIVAVVIALVFLTPKGPGAGETPTTPTTAPQQGGEAAQTTTSQTPVQVKAELKGVGVYVKDPTPEQLSRGVLAVVELELKFTVTGDTVELKKILIQPVNYIKNITIEINTAFNPSPEPIVHSISHEITDQDDANALKNPQLARVRVYVVFSVEGKEEVQYKLAVITKVETTTTTPIPSP